MRPPWLGESRETAELEALQTDVMRFIAILGLCLAAIFSLVHSAAIEQAAPAALQQVTPPPEPPATREIPPADVSVAQPESAPVAQPERVPIPEPQLAPPAQPAGFSLEFASVAALESLLREQRAHLYAIVRGQFWLVDAAGTLAQSDAPASYYHMHAATVPKGFRRLLPASVAGQDVAWGVTLPTVTGRQIEQLLNSAGGGRLVIGAQGRVALR